MNKSIRMKIVELLHAFIRDNKYPLVINKLKNVIEIIGENLFIDCLIIGVYKIPTKGYMSISMLVSQVIAQLASEILYHLIISDMTKNDIKEFDRILKNKNKDFCGMLERINPNRTFNCKQNLSTLFLKIKRTSISMNSALYPKLSNKYKNSLISKSKEAAVKIRVLITEILMEFLVADKLIEFVTPYNPGKLPPLCVRRIKEIEILQPYMFLTPQNILDTPLHFAVSENSTVTKSIENALNRTHTLDSEFNKIILSIIDTPLFERLLGGNSSDIESVRAKTRAARIEIKEGVALWESLGKQPIYFSYTTDFRGRINQLGGISAVGNKAGKAMLRSGVKYPFGFYGYDDLLIGLAGAMGLSKKTFKQRLEWGISNSKVYSQIGGMLLHSPAIAFEALLSYGADQIFTAASICLELYRVQNYNGDIKEYESDLYLGYDATSSAVQLVGLLMGNSTLTVSSNASVSSDTEDKIYDAYMLLADSMDVASKRTDLDIDTEQLRLWRELSPSHKRSIAKPLLMTRLYGSTFLTHKESVAEVVVNSGVINVKDRDRVKTFSTSIAKLFNKTFNEEEGFNCFRAYEKFAKDIAKAYNEINKPAVWTLQDVNTVGIQRVKSNYYKLSGFDYKAYYDGKPHRHQCFNLDILNDCLCELDFTKKTELNKTKAISAIPPNFIHSHDALLLHTISLKVDAPMRLTHDCFGAPVGKIRDMQEAIDSSYAELFGDNKLKQLECLQQECYANTGILVELPPEYNSNGIPEDQIRKAKYKCS